MISRKLSYSPSLFHNYMLQQMIPELQFNSARKEDWKRELTAKILEILGIPPQTKIPLASFTLWRKTHPFGQIEKIVFSSDTFADVPAYVCIPNNCIPPYRFFICLQGHFYGMHASVGLNPSERRKMFVKRDLDLAIGCMKRGVAALCLEMRSMGQRSEHHLQKKSKINDCQDAAMHSLLLGYSLIGERISDVRRGIEYLKTRRDVQMNELGIMGNSGGGTVALYGAAILKEIKYVILSCCFSYFKDSIMSIPHCADNYVPGILRYADMPDIAGLHAPLPIIFVSAKNDHLFPLKSALGAFADVRKIYGSFNALANCAHVIGNKGHRFYPEPAWEKILELMKQNQTNTIGNS